MVRNDYSDRISQNIYKRWYEDIYLIAWMLISRKIYKLSMECESTPFLMYTIFKNIGNDLYQ